MSVQALTWAFGVRGLSPSEKLVLLSLANYANKENRCWPKQDSIAEETELSSRTVWTALKGLSDKGLIEREARKRSDGTRTTDVFTLNFDAEPVANLANSSRKSCEVQSQPLRKPVAAVATLTTFEPSITEPSIEEPIEAAILAAPPDRPPKRGTRLPEDWEPTPEDFQFALAQSLTPEDVNREAAKFRNYWCSRSSGATKLNWHRTWQNWAIESGERARRDRERLASRPAFAGSSRSGPTDFAEIVARRRSQGYQ